MKSATEVIATDLDLLSHQLGAEFDALSGRSVLIAGGAGFLGYYLVQITLLLEPEECGPSAPIRVTVLDNFVRGVPEWLTGLEQDPNLRLLKHDITQPLPASWRPRYLVHAASIASPTYYRKFPIETMDANVNGLRHAGLLSGSETEGKGGRGSFVLFEQRNIRRSHLGDIPTQDPIADTSPAPGLAPVTTSRNATANPLCEFCSQHGLPIKVARPFNNYGPGLKITDSSVIPDFARNILGGETS